MPKYQTEPEFLLGTELKSKKLGNWKKKDSNVLDNAEYCTGVANCYDIHAFSRWIVEIPG
ncbi:integral membrane protein [Colletotrichum scovillei]|uniref:Integral membrane protein n=1 Tax=Colletotrichum scovillei TaxID=1209932 RepID=A0A9P7R1T5_9PEZI|nr:integral membrane protein [Colletotrichum scovillei]KAG7059552.1 integral membrane protein [Colletotrichum scovillei]KAG7066998.1 integral membrane protein [Colletotrichum scovillei]